MKYIVLALLLMGCVQPETKSPLDKPLKPIKIVREECDITPVKVAIIDTGLVYNDYSINAKLCKYGHVDFSPYNIKSDKFGTKMQVPTDTHGHGTNIAGLIEREAGNTNYCLIIIKYYDPKAYGNNNLQATIKSFKYANEIGADIINYSGGGLDYSQEEHDAVISFLDRGGKFFAAAGNEDSDIKTHPYYPASYDYRITVVGNAMAVDQDKYERIHEMDKTRNLVHVDGYEGVATRHPASNYGETMIRWEFGSAWAFGYAMTGTSQATAIATGKTVKQINRKCKKSVDTVSK